MSETGPLGRQAGFFLRNDSYREADSRSTTLNRSAPNPIAHHRTHGRSRAPLDIPQYAYISTEMEGYVGNILVIYDIRDPARPSEVSRWWMPGQHVAGSEQPAWAGRRNRLHHALRFGDELWAGCWHAGLRVIDVSDSAAAHIGRKLPSAVRSPRTLSCRAGGERRQAIALAIDEEDPLTRHEMDRRRGRPHGCLGVE